MKNSLLLGLLALSLLCPSFAWGQTNTPVEKETPQVSGRILLNTKTPPSLNEEVILEITLENTGKRPLRFHDGAVEYFYEFEVTANNKKVARLPTFPMYPPLRFSSQGFVIPPQGKQKGYFYLNRAFDLSKEGSYIVTVSKKSRQEQVEGIFTITSQPFEIKITHPQDLGYWESYSPPAAPQADTPATKQP